MVKGSTIPTETNLKNLWCKLMRREDGRDGFVVSKETRVCDAHFLPSAIVYGKLDRKADPKPILHSWNNFTVKEPRRRLVRQVDVEDVADVPSTSEEMEVEVVNVVDEVVDVGREAPVVFERHDDAGLRSGGDALVD